MTDSPPTPIVAILAGGANRRMGSDKALLPLNGRPMIAHVAAAARRAGFSSLVVGRVDAPIDAPTTRDDLSGRRGPAVGLATALRFAQGRPVFLVATDQPMLRPDTVKRLLSIEGDVVVPVDRGTRQVTCAVYRSQCLEPLLDLIDERTTPSLQALLDDVDTREVPPEEWSVWGEDGRSWWSLDTRADVAKAEAWILENRESRDDNRKPESNGD